MAGLWKTAKTNCRFSPVSTTPWKSGKGRRIPTFPPLPPLFFFIQQNRKTRKDVGRCAASASELFFRITLDWKRYLISGSSVDWKML